MKHSIFGLDEAAKCDEGQALLCTVYSPTELSVILGILEGAEIPFLVKERGAGGVSKVILGYSISGTDIYVPEAALDAAAELIAPAESDEVEEGEENDDLSE
jgi:hypothetical protein